MTARRAASNEGTDKYADHAGDGIGEAEKPRRNLIHVRRDGYPDAEDDRREDDPPTTRNKADDQTGSERGDKDHRSVVGAVASCLDLRRLFRWGDIPEHWPSRPRRPYGVLSTRRHRPVRMVSSVTLT
jgi:hypothetical protein